jgi:hypothetical protein
MVLIFGSEVFIPELRENLLKVRAEVRGAGAQPALPEFPENFRFFPVVAGSNSGLFS